MSSMRDVLVPVAVAVISVAGMCCGAVVSSLIVMRYGWPERDTIMAGLLGGMVGFGCFASWLLTRRR